MANFDALHKAVKDLDGASSTFVPDDVESLYEEWREGEDNWPEFSEVKDELLESYYWTNAIEDRMTEVGWEVISQMISETMFQRNS